ncbi:MAG: sulfatase [Polyangiaceae bacterium]|nr:sulfatase [Polyangiaceae bacterium]
MRGARLLEALRPPVLGALWMLGQTAWLARRASSDSRVGGVEASQVTDAIQKHFAHHIQDTSWLLVGCALGVGWMLGAAASGLIWLRAWLVGNERPTWPRLHLEALGWIAGLQGGALLLALARRPQLYEEFFYGAGGARRLLQVLCTDVLGQRGLALLLMLALVAALVGGPGRWGRLRERWRVLRRGGAGALLAGALLAVWPTSPEARAEDPRVNVLILAADSLRADRLRPGIAPRLAAFSQGAVGFEEARVSLPRTFPSWVTLLTGKYPHHHGIRNMFPSRAARARDFDALPGRLQQAGYHTAVVSDYAGDIFPRIRLGFSRVDTPTFHLGELVRQRAIEAQIGLLPFLDTRAGRALVPSMLGHNRAPDAEGVARRALQAIDEARGKPFFLVTFFSTAHFPYASPDPGYRRFTDAGYRGRFKYQKVNTLGREAPPDEHDERQIRGLYDGAVSVVDEAMGAVLDGLAARGLSGRTVVVVTADHGETLFEQGRGHGHGDHLFGEEALAVPLLFRDGRRPEPRRVWGLARDVDLAPTLYELTGVAPPGDLDGVSLAPALRGAPLTTEHAFAETGLWFTEETPGVPHDLRLPYPDISRMGEIVRDAGDDVVLQQAYFPTTVLAKHRAVYSRDRKLILAPTRQGLRTLLFDPIADPANLRDLSELEPETSARLKSTLLQWVLQDPMLELRGEHLIPRGVAAERAPASETFRLEGP